MASILFSVFSGQASGIFDVNLERTHNRYVDAKKTGNLDELHNIFILETQWDNGGHTGYLLKFYDWLKTQPEFEKELWKGFRYPPPMGDLKSQISRWHKFLIKGEHNDVSMISHKYKDVNVTLQMFQSLIEQLRILNPRTFVDEDKMNFLSTFCRLYEEFAEEYRKQNPSEEAENHSVGNLFLSFLYFYSFLVRETIDIKHEHHHELFFNFLKDLSLAPRGVRLEFLIDGRFNLSGVSYDGIKITSEHKFDKYPATKPVDPTTYSLEAVDGEDIETKYRMMVEQSDVVVIPPGSLSNWMPLMNKFKDILSTKPMIWIVNSFYHVSEIELHEQIKYLHELGLKPIIMAPLVDHPFEEIKFGRQEFEDTYYDQGKTPENFTNALDGFEDYVIRCIPLKELEAGEGGIKYNPIYIDKLLSILMDRLDHEKEINFEIVRGICKEVAFKLFPENRKLQ